MKSLKLALVVFAWLFAALAGGGPSVALAGDLIPGVDYAPGEVLVTFKDVYMPAQQEVSLSPPRFGIAGLDMLIEEYGGASMEKFLQSYNRATSDAGRFLEHTFILKFGPTVDTEDVVARFRGLPYFEYVDLNRIYVLELFGTRREEPNPESRLDNNFHLDTLTVGDHVDIDAPETWAIEKGDPGVIIGILDTGTMLCSGSFWGPWQWHHDFNLYWNTAEDWMSPNVLVSNDIACGVNYSDDNGDGVRDNIIGHTYYQVLGCDPDNDPCPDCPNPAHADSAAAWYGIPHNWSLSVQKPGPTSFKITYYLTHGTMVGSLAAAKWEGHNIIGVAPQCQVYNARSHFGASGAPVGDHAKMVLESSGICDVMNMSWGSRKIHSSRRPFSPQRKTPIACWWPLSGISCLA